MPRLLDGLTVRIALLLTLALLPIGLIAVSLTRQVSENAARREESAILALTAEAAAGEASFLRAGATVAGALAAALPVVRDQPADCSGIFRAFVEGRPQYAFAGYFDRDGIIRCGSKGVGEDISGTVTYRMLAATPAPRIDVSDSGYISKQSVVILTQPVFTATGAFDGGVILSMLNRRMFREVGIAPPERPLSLVTFTQQGRLLSTDGEGEGVYAQLPAGRALTEFAGGPRTSFTGPTRSGEMRVFAVVPMLPGEVYALGSWPLTRTAVTLETVAGSPLILVGLMWLVSLGVAYMAVHRLAIRNIVGLRERMSHFIATRRHVRVRPNPWQTPREFREIDRTFEDLAETVVREEAELENIIHGRTVLLKEVHHRVKNNLQLIASIVSMKIRKARSPEARVVLKEVQMRVMSIAMVHQALYTTSNVARVQADELLRGLIAKLLDAGTQSVGALRVDTAYDPIELYPDQAVPLSLLAAEAVTNALKYLGRPAEGAPWIRVTLCHEAGGKAMLEVANSRGTPIVPPEQAQGTGLGINLMNAFAMQMRGKLSISDADPLQHMVQVTFEAAGFDASPVDSAIPEAHPQG